MKENLPQRKSIRLRNYDYSQPGFYFVTVCTAVRGENILCSIVPAAHSTRSVGGGLCAAPRINLTQTGQIVPDSILKIPTLNPGVFVDIYVIMPDHIHLILNLTGRPGGRPLPGILGRFKSYTDHCYRKLDCPYDPYLWQEGYYEHIIRNDSDLRETRLYIRNNPLKWLQDKE